MAFDFPASPTEGQTYAPPGGPTYVWHTDRWVFQGGPGGGVTSTTYVHDQLTPAATWTVTHALGQWPSVTVVDSGGNVIVGDVHYVDTNSVTLSFSVSFGGRCYCNA